MVVLNVEQGDDMSLGAWASRAFGAKHRALAASASGEGPRAREGVRVRWPVRVSRRTGLARVGAAVVVVLGALVGTAAVSGSAQSASQGPCDIYAAGGRSEERRVG